MILDAALLGGPALAHQFEQVRQGVFVGAAFLRGQLLGTFIELGSHFGGFLEWTAKGDEQGSQFFEVHWSGELGLKSLYGLGGHDLDALETHAFERPIRAARRGGGDSLEHIVTFD
jgi:hypothetical protein